MIKRLFSTRTIGKFPITITDNAWNKMNKIVKKKNDTNFLFSAIGGGCNGFNYNLKLIDNEKYQQLFESDISNNIKPSTIENDKTTVIIEPMSEIFLLGTTIDYISEDYDKGIFENKFIFIPDKNLASTCGCGVSFTPK